MSGVVQNGQTTTVPVLEDIFDLSLDICKHPIADCIPFCFLGFQDTLMPVLLLMNSSAAGQANNPISQLIR